MQSLQREMAEQDVVWLTVISSAPGTQGHVSPAQADELTANRNAARAVLAGETPDRQVTRPYGCTVKYVD
ncbi:MAG: hypothetical protein M1473_08355 [Firmicutes bacterium]|nr:hypothetical protein [Bacillota bacterium]